MEQIWYLTFCIGYYVVHDSFLLLRLCTFYMDFFNFVYFFDNDQKQLIYIY